jgi:outer membrane protein assembly factor BamB
VVVGLDLESGKEAWRCDLGTPVFAAPAVSGNALFVADWGGNVYAFAGR